MDGVEVESNRVVSGEGKCLTHSHIEAEQEKGG